MTPIIVKNLSNDQIFFLLHRLVVPLIFKQYFVIHVMIGNKYIPCAYVYMSGKYEEADYDRVFAALKKIGIEHSSDGKGFNPSEMQCDFELASQNSFKKCFPNATVYCCLFHFGQAVNRKIGSLGYKVNYNTDFFQ